MLYLVLSVLAPAFGLQMLGTRRSVIRTVATLLTAPPGIACAAEPEPAKMLTDEEMAARVARKAELLKKQGRKQAADAKVVYGAAYQAGKREAEPSAGSAGFVGFLLPGDVGGVNLGNPFASSPAPSR